MQTSMTVEACKPVVLTVNLGKRDDEISVKFEYSQPVIIEVNMFLFGNAS